MLFSCAMLNAQEKIEVKLNPLGIIFGSPELVGEYFLTERFSAKLALSAEMGKYGAVSTDDYNPKKSGFGIMLSGRYYFEPEEGNDRWFTGLYLRNKTFNVKDDSSTTYGEFQRKVTAAGILVGKKWVTSNNITFELALGLGRPISESNEWKDENETSDFENFEFGIDAVGRLAIGYRF